MSLFKAADSENRSMPSLPLIGEMPLTPAAMALAPLRRPVLQLFQLGLLTGEGLQLLPEGVLMGFEDGQVGRRCAGSGVLPQRR